MPEEAKHMTTTPEQIEDALAAFALASGLGIFPDDEKDEEWREDLVNGMRAAIDTMRPIIRAEALEEAADVAECAPYNKGGIVCGCSEGLGNWTAAAIRALKDKP